MVWDLGPPGTWLYRPGWGWDVTRIGVKDALLDAQTLRTAGSAPYGGADIGECLAVAAQVRGTDLTSWHDAWASAAARVLALAEGELAAGRPESARLAFWRSSSYYRTAGVMLMGARRIRGWWRASRRRRMRSGAARLC